MRSIGQPRPARRRLSGAESGGSNAYTSAISVTRWSGVGYIILDPETGPGAWKISGGSNGGAYRDDSPVLGGTLGTLLASSGDDDDDSSILGDIVGFLRTPEAMNSRNRHCPICGKKFPLGLFGGPTGRCRQCASEIGTTYGRNGAINLTTLVWVLLLPGVLNLRLHFPLLSFALALPVAAIWYVLFPRGYRAICSEDRGRQAIK